MKRIAIVCLVLFSVIACKEKECEGPNCPLLDGTECTGNLININNECVCPEGTIKLGDDTCLKKSTETEGWLDNWSRYVGKINCNCINADFRTTFTKEGFFNATYNLYGVFNSDNTSFLEGSTRENFVAQYHFWCNIGDGVQRYMRAEGRMTPDTLYFDKVYFMPPNEALDTCYNLKFFAW